MDIFEGFDGRDDDLRLVKRYSNYPVMLYRSNLYTHQHRVAALVRRISPIARNVFGKKYDPNKAEMMARVHDDAEIVFGDIVAGYKYKMTKAQLDEVKQAEKRAIETIAKRFPTMVRGYNYEELLREYESYSSLEAQVVCYADKYDALGEALHEVYAGNLNFVTHFESVYGEVPSPLEYYTEYFKLFRQRFPLTSALLDEPFDMFSQIEYPLEKYRDVAKHGSIHSEKSIKSSTGDTHYDIWKSVTHACGDDETAKSLHLQKENL